MSGPLRDHALNRRRVDDVGQAVAAQQQCRVRLEWHLLDFDEIGVVRLVRLRADIAIHLVAPRVVHRLELGDLPRILAFADRRVVSSHLVDEAVAEAVEPGVADVRDGGASLVDDGHREDAGHARPLRPQAGQPMNLVVGHRDGFAQPLRNRTGFPLQPGPEEGDRRVGRLAAGRLAADPVDDHEDAARQVEMKTVFVDLAQKSRIRVPCRSNRAHCTQALHQRMVRNSRVTVSARPMVAVSGTAVSAPFSRLLPSTSS